MNNGHIHGPADAGVTAGAVLNFNTLSGASFSFGATSGTGHGTALMTSATAFTPTVNGDSLKKLCSRERRMRTSIRPTTRPVKFAGRSQKSRNDCGVLSFFS